MEESIKLIRLMLLVSICDIRNSDSQRLWLDESRASQISASEKVSSTVKTYKVAKFKYMKVLQKHLK